MTFLQAGSCATSVLLVTTVLLNVMEGPLQGWFLLSCAWDCMIGACRMP